jgi:hypothetical protein
MVGFDRCRIPHKETENPERGHQARIIGGQDALAQYGFTGDSK